MRTDLSKLPASARGVLAALTAAGFESYFAGGCVRDLLMGVPPGDVDIATAALPEQVQALFPRTVPTGLRHGTVTVVTEDASFEVTTFRADGDYADGRHPEGVRFGVSPEEDALRRDLTVNALFCDGEGEVLDFVGGREDLHRGLLRAVGDPDRRFREDALRMLRVYRFRAKTGFCIHPDTEAAIARNASLCAALSAERVLCELTKTLESPRPELAGEMFRAGLLHCFLPGDGPTEADLRGIARCPAESRLALLAACLADGDAEKAGALLRGLKARREDVLLGQAVAACREMPLGTSGEQKRALWAVGEKAVRAECARRPEIADPAWPEAVLQSGEPYLPGMLRISGEEAASLVSAPEKTGALLRALTEHCIDCPWDNIREKLIILAKELSF